MPARSTHPSPMTRLCRRTEWHRGRLRCRHAVSRAACLPAISASLPWDMRAGFPCAHMGLRFRMSSWSCYVDRMVWRLLLACGVAVSAALVGCANPACWAGESEAGSCESGPCRDGDDCVSGTCVAGVCDPPCASHSECAAGSYCVVWDGPFGYPRRHCESICGEAPDGRRLYLIESEQPLVCHEGVPTACSALADTEPYCERCGCAGGQTCLPWEGCATRGECSCRAPMPLGSTCSYHEDCESGNCSGTLLGGTRLCQLPAGSPCDPAMTDQCFWCEEGEPGVFRCQQSCEGAFQCSICVGYTDLDQYTCRMGCSMTRTCMAGYECRYLDSVDTYACMPTS